MLVAIDPGNDTGLAVFDMQSGLLQHCEVIKRDLQQLYDRLVQIRGHFNTPVSKLVCEIPEVYRARFLKGNPNDLIPMAVQAGWVEALGFMLMVPQHSCTLVTPKKWKGQIPKDVCAQRAKDQLIESERRRVEFCLAKTPKGKKHNAWDAIALGLWRLKRVHVRS